jgi:lipoprotein NlpI
LDDTKGVIDLISIEEATEHGKPAWKKEIEYDNTYGYAIMNELAFFYVASKNLSICDLIQWHTKDTTPEVFPPRQQLVGGA